MRDSIRRLTPLLAGSVLGLALTGCGAQFAKDQQAQADLQAAMQKAQVGQIAEARRWADRAITVAPKSINTYLGGSTPDGSLSLLGIADAGGGENGVFTSIGDDADVVAYMARAAQALPNDPVPLLVQSQAQGRLGDVAGQRTTAAKEAALLEHQLTVPGHRIGADLMNTLAQAYWDAGDQVKGAATFRRVIATYPHDNAVADADNGLAYDYAVANDTAHLPEALGLAKTALSLAQKQDRPDAEKDSLVGAIQDTLGWVQYRQGDDKNALINVQKGVNTNPRLPEGRYHLAMVYKALGNTDAARIELSYAVHLSQGYAAAQRELETLPQPSPAPKLAAGKA